MVALGCPKQGQSLDLICFAPAFTLPALRDDGILIIPMSASLFPDSTLSVHCTPPLVPRLRNIASLHIPTGASCLIPVPAPPVRENSALSLAPSGVALFHTRAFSPPVYFSLGVYPESSCFPVFPLCLRRPSVATHLVTVVASQLVPWLCARFPVVSGLSAVPLKMSGRADPVPQNLAQLPQSRLLCM